MIVSVGLCLSILPHSFAISHVQVDSPITEPNVGFNKESDGWYLTFAYVFVDPNYNEGKPCLFLIDHNKVSSDTSLNLTFGYPSYSSGNIGQKTFFLYTWQIRGYSSLNQQIRTLNYSVLDIQSGNLLVQFHLDAKDRINNLQSYSLPLISGGYRFFTDGSEMYGYPLSSSDYNTVNFNFYPEVYNINPFVNWGVRPPDVPDQIQLKSPLSEPTADKYNSYAVLDDRLIWISYRINGIYSRSASIENISEVYSYNAQINESGKGTYAGQQNGYTDNIVIPSQSYSGSSSGNIEEFSGGGDIYGNSYDHASPQNSFIGVYTYDFDNINFSGNHSGFLSGTSLGNIDFSGVNTGNVHFNSNGTVSLQDIEYYPVSFNHNDIFEYYRLYCLPTDSDNFVFWLAPDRSFVPLASVNQLLVNMEFYYSEFDLEGNYIRSEMHTVTETDIGLFDSYQSEEPIHSVKFYGIDFFNIDNLPFNLSSVLWQYDYEFKQWRDNMYSKLSEIYNVLSQSESLSSYQGKEFGSQLNAHNALDDLSYNSNSVNSNINSLLGESINKLGSDGGVLRSLTANIIALGNGKIFSLLIITLAAGVIILLLGKNKND